MRRALLYIIHAVVPFNDRVVGVYRPANHIYLAASTGKGPNIMTLHSAMARLQSSLDPAVLQELKDRNFHAAPLAIGFDIVWFENNCKHAFNYSMGLGMVWFANHDDYLNYVLTWY